MGAADAASCFDRVSRPYATIVSRKKGMPSNIYKCASLVVKNLEHSVKTSAGPSQETYREEDGDTKLSGIPQGTAHIMAIHTLVSDTILEPYKTVIRSTGKPLEMVSPDMTLCSDRTVDMYVDDAVLFTGMGTQCEEHPSLEDANGNDTLEASDTVTFASENIRQSLQLWCDASQQTGQQANLSKYECIPTFFVRNKESRL